MHLTYEVQNILNYLNQQTDHTQRIRMMVQVTNQKCNSLPWFQLYGSFVRFCKGEQDVKLRFFFHSFGLCAVIGLEKVTAHIINKDLLQNQKAFTAAHHCLRSLLESMVDLKDSMDSSESDRSGSSDSQSDSGSSQDDDDDGSMNVSKG